MRILVLLLGLAIVGPAAFGDRPNILFVLTDDQAPWALGASGNPEAHTPHMDRFFNENAYLTNCFVVTPVCSPSRSSLMTSRYGTEVGVTDWINPREEPELGLDPEYVTWPEILQDAGYETALVGKWHLGTAPRFHPLKNGFEVFRGFLEGGTKVENGVLEIDGATRETAGLTVDVLTNQAIDFLEKDRGDRPFLLCLHYRSPHSPWLPVDDSDWAPYADLDPTIPNPDYPDLDVELVKSKMKEYLASTTGVDRNFGRLLDALDQLGLSENTVVIYMSDHGYNMGHNGMWHKGNGHWITKAKRNAVGAERQRPNMFDNSIRIPAAVRWPGATKAGQRIEETVDSLDWYPTLLAMAGVEAPEGVLLRGEDVAPLLKGESVRWDNNLYGQYSQHHYTKTHQRMYRTPEWKLVRDFNREGFDEFFDLVNDPAETTNLITRPEHQDRITEMHSLLIAEMEKIGDLVHQR